MLHRAWSAILSRMNLSSIPFTSPVGKLLRLPLRVLPERAVVPVLQGGLRGRRWIVGSSTHGCWLGTYEHENQRLFASLVPANGTVYDIGANVGFYTLLAASRAKRVIAVEPLSENLAYLKRHLDLNGVCNVEVWPAAVADKEGDEPFAAAGDRSQGKLGGEGPLVPTVTLDRLCEICGPPALIKVDVEGAEYRVLLGAQKCLAAYRPIIFVSTHSISLHRACITLLTDSGYDVQQVGNDGLLALRRLQTADGKCADRAVS
jgi:FkbM family methyltransferase